MPLISPQLGEHWEARLRRTITGTEAAPMAISRFWCHCHNCKKYESPNMTPQQLSSICRWRIRKLSCEDALVQVGFLDKLPSNGYRAHGFRECNGGLCQRWESGSRGGRPSESEKGNENAGDNKTGAKPDANRHVTGAKPINQPTGSLTTSNEAPQSGRTDSDSSKVYGLDGRTDGRTDGLPSIRALTFRIPTESEVFTYLNCQFKGAGQYARPFLKAMKESGWKSSNDGRQIQNWQNAAKGYANAAARNKINQT